MPYSLSAPVTSELIIRKSRFLGRVEPVTDRVQALERVAAVRAEHPGATHVCWALMAGGHSAANDDGEPGGTAGRPMLEVLRHQDLDGVLATVVRYYGGILLGAGGLVRAYTDSVAQALLQSRKVPRTLLTTLSCTVPYALEGWLRRELAAQGATLGAVEHGQAVTLAFSVPQDAAAALVARINDASQGQALWLRPEAGGV